MLVPSRDCGCPADRLRWSLSGAWDDIECYGAFWYLCKHLLGTELQFIFFLILNQSSLVWTFVRIAPTLGVRGPHLSGEKLLGCVQSPPGSHAFRIGIQKRSQLASLKPCDFLWLLCTAAAYTLCNIVLEEELISESWGSYVGTGCCARVLLPPWWLWSVRIKHLSPRLTINVFQSTHLELQLPKYLISAWVPVKKKAVIWRGYGQNWTWSISLFFSFWNKPNSQNALLSPCLKLWGYILACISSSALHVLLKKIVCFYEERLELPWRRVLVVDSRPQHWDTFQFVQVLFKVFSRQKLELWKLYWYSNSAWIILEISKHGVLKASWESATAWGVFFAY